MQPVQMLRTIEAKHLCRSIPSFLNGESFQNGEVVGNQLVCVPIANSSQPAAKVRADHCASIIHAGLIVIYLYGNAYRCDECPTHDMDYAIYLYNTAQEACTLHQLQWLSPALPTGI